MAWASSGGYPGVVSDGAGGIIVGIAGSGGHVHLESDGTITGSGLTCSSLYSSGPVYSDNNLGTAGGIGLFLKAAARFATAGGAATAGGTYTATEEAMLNAAYTALRSIGLIT